jgi:hypothetical protein
MIDHPSCVIDQWVGVAFGWRCEIRCVCLYEQSIGRQVPKHLSLCVLSRMQKIRGKREVGSAGGKPIHHLRRSTAGNESSRANCAPRRAGAATGSIRPALGNHNPRSIDPARSRRSRNPGVHRQSPAMYRANAKSGPAHTMDAIQTTVEPMAAPRQSPRPATSPPRECR